MIRINCSVSLVTFLWMMILVRADTDVTCYRIGSCILPCSFQEDPEVVIKWTKLTEGLPRVHSFSNNQDQLQDQDQNFRNRTSLSKDQISRGDASLLLRGVRDEDKGKYQCYTRTISGINKSIINLNVIDIPLIVGVTIPVAVVVTVTVVAVCIYCKKKIREIEKRIRERMRELRERREKEQRELEEFEQWLEMRNQPTSQQLLSASS